MRKELVGLLAVGLVALGTGTVNGAVGRPEAVLPRPAGGRDATVRLQPGPGAVPGAEDVVRALYRRVSFEAGRNVDWDQVKAMFLPEAVIVLRTSRTAMSVFDRDGFVRDFVKFIADAKLEDRAFEEKIVAIDTVEAGDIARATVHYAARIPSDSRPAQEGIDMFTLLKQAGTWKIVSIVNEVVRPGLPLPHELRK